MRPISIEKAVIWAWFCMLVQRVFVEDYLRCFFLCTIIVLIEAVIRLVVYRGNDLGLCSSGDFELNSKGMCV